jgi:hypothetical protein
MARKSAGVSLEQTLDALRAHAFDVSASTQVAGGMLVAKHGAGAVLVEAGAAAASAKESGSHAALAIAPGALVRGEVGRLVDRGYQKFIKTAQFEIPALATQLQAIHEFSAELNLVTGDLGLYNEALGTTSDLYLYDRLKDRELLGPTPAAPWEAGKEH